MHTEYLGYIVSPRFAPGKYALPPILVPVAMLHQQVEVVK